MRVLIIFFIRGALEVYGYVVESILGFHFVAAVLSVPSSSVCYNQLFCFLYFYASLSCYILFLCFLMYLDEFQIFRKYTFLFAL